MCVQLPKMGAGGLRRALNYVDHTFRACLDVASLDELIHGLLMPFGLHTIHKHSLGVKV